MARGIEKIKPVTLDRLAKKPGIYGDGGGLYLVVKSATSRSWVFRFMLNRRAREMGLGSYPERSLAEARSLAFDARKLLVDDIDPIADRDAARAQAQLDAAKAITFKDAAERYIAAHKAGWRNAKHADQWTATLTTYGFPVIGALPVAGVDTGLVLKVLEPIWTTKPETAGRVRGRMEAVLDWAKVRGYRIGDNPARWRGHLDKLLPAQSKVRKVEHHAALPYSDIPAFMTALRAQGGTAARALEFTILTVARTGETIGAVPDEVKEKIWTVPADRMKAGKEHRVPLSPNALAILETVKEEGAAHIFRGGKKNKPLSNMAMLKLLGRMGRADLTVHGFRSTFHDWASERTNFQNEVIEMALAHAIEDKTEAAYRRGDLFEKRRRLMQAWADYCVSKPATGTNVVSIQKVAAE